MPENKRKQQSFEYGAIILLCSTMLVKVIGAIFKIPLSNLIGDLGFGYFSSAYDLFTPIYALAMAGLPIAVSRVVAENMTKGNYKDVRQSLKITKRIFFLTGLTGFLLMLALIYPFVKVTDPTGKTIYSLFAIAPALLFCCITSAFRGYFEGLRNMYPTAISDVTESMGKLVLGLGFAYIAMRVTEGNVAIAAAAAMLGITAGSMAAALYLFLRHKIKGDGITEEEYRLAPDAQPMGKATRALILIALPIVLSSLANNVASLVDVSFVKIQLANLMESGADTIREMYKSSIDDYNSFHDALTDKAIPTFLYGIRGKAFTIYNLVPTITSVLGVSALPVLTTMWTQKNKAGLKRNMESTMKLTAIIAMPAGMGFLFMGDGIMALIYDTVASVEIGGAMMRIFGVAAIFAGMAIPMTSMLQAIGKEKFSLMNVAIGAAIKVIVNIIFVGIPSINIKGAAIGTAACYAFIFFANLISLIKFTGVIPNFYKSLIKPLISALACGGTALLCYKILGEGSIKVIVSILAGAVVYFAFLVLLNTFEEEDVVSLPKGEKIARLCKKLKIIR